MIENYFYVVRYGRCFSVLDGLEDGIFCLLPHFVFLFVKLLLPPYKCIDYFAYRNDVMGSPLWINIIRVNAW